MKANYNKKNENKSDKNKRSPQSKFRVDSPDRGFLSFMKIFKKWSSSDKNVYNSKFFQNVINGVLTC